LNGDGKRDTANKSCTHITRKGNSCPIADVEESNTKSALLKVRIMRKVSSPVTGLSGPEGSRKLKFPDFLKTAQDGGKVFNLTHRQHLPSGNTPGTLFC
jgi:hypothetical protein